jgi:hypothetical protein
VDRPLDAPALAAVRALSTRARITPTSFINTYQWGDFKGDPRALVERYYDAFLYTANWGTRQVMLRLPVTLLDLRTAERYCTTDDVEPPVPPGLADLPGTHKDALLLRIVQGNVHVGPDYAAG